MKKLDKSIWLISVIVLVFIGSLVALFFVLKADPIAEDVAQKRQIKIVFMVHNSYELTFCDLFCYDTQTGQSALFDLPSHTGVWDQRLSRYQFLSNFYQMGQPEKFLKTINGFADDTYPYFIDFTEENLGKMIDLMGGIQAFLVDPISVQVDGETRLLPAGSFNMQGYQALLYMTQYLPGETSNEFIKRRQAVVKSLLSELPQISKNFNNATLRKKFISLFRSNLDRQSLQTLLKELEAFDGELMQVQQLRGELKKINGISFFLPQADGRLFREQLRQISKALGDSSFIKRELLTLNLEVLNGTNRNLMAANTTEHYQSYGYNVISTGNYKETNLEKTIVFYRLPEFERAAIRIGEIINCTNIVLAEETSNTDEDGERLWNGADVSIVLGRDYEPFSCRN